MTKRAKTAPTLIATMTSVPRPSSKSKGMASIPGATVTGSTRREVNGSNPVEPSSERVELRVDVSIERSVRTGTS